ncbi:MAG: purine-nucleoside phosphorylase [Treponema sp.]|jgi:purine-nucleoside phosphorylase|nr:purine-nucleoside phosphorylase [Treponema sp.]
MSTHIAAEPGEIAEAVLLPGDPLRAKFIAETFLEDAHCYTRVRNMLGFTGRYKGVPVSVQGTGMGIPSISIYLNELLRDYGVQRAIRVGTAGSIQERIKVRDLIIALSSCTDSGANALRFGGRTFAPTATFSLVQKAYAAAAARGWTPFVGPVVSTDMFYHEDPDEWKLWARWGALALEMESAELYTLAAKYGREALCLLTVSDSLVSAEETTSAEREKTFTRMIEVALETALS